MYFTGTPKRLATSPAMSGATPTGSPASVLPVTSKKFDRLMPARRTPVGANSALTCCDMGASSCLTGADCDKAACGSSMTSVAAKRKIHFSTIRPRHLRSASLTARVQPAPAAVCPGWPAAPPARSPAAPAVRLPRPDEPCPGRLGVPCRRCSGCALLFHGQFGLEAGDIAVDRGDGQGAPAAPIADQAVLGGNFTIDGDLIPGLCMPDIVDRQVVMLAPEKWHGSKFLAQPQHVEGGGLPLPLGHHPMLDANRAAAIGVGPASNVAGGEDTRRPGLEIAVNQHATVDGDARLLGELQARAHADPGDDEIGLELATAFELDALCFDGGGGVFEMKRDAMLAVKGSHEVADLRPEQALHRPRLRRHHVNFDTTGAQRSCNLEPDETGTQHDRTFCLGRRRDDALAIRQRAQHMNVRLAGARDRQADGFGTGCQQQPLVTNLLASCQYHLLGARIDGGDTRLELQVNAVLGVVAIGPQRQPVLRSVTGQIVLGEIGPIHGRHRIFAQDTDGTLVVATPQHFGRGKAGRTAADNDNAGWRRGCLWRALPLWLRRYLAAHANFAVPPFHRPTGQRREGRSVECLTAAEAETGVMPGTTHGVVNHQTVRQGTAVVRAAGIDGKELLAAPCQQDGVVADAAGQHLPIAERVDGNALRQIWTGRLVLCCSHGWPPVLHAQSV